MSEPKSTHRAAVSAVIVHDGKILCVRKGFGKQSYDSGKYEFPGGKMKKGESEAAAVVREVEEELGMQVLPTRKLLTVDHQYPDAHYTIHAWLCTCESPDLELREHIECHWLPPDELHKPDWAAAEVPVVKELDRLGKRIFDNNY